MTAAQAACCVLGGAMAMWRGMGSAISFFGLSGGAVATVFVVMVTVAFAFAFAFVFAFVAALFGVAGVVLLAARAVVFAPVFLVAPFLAVPVVAAFVARAEGDGDSGAGHVDAHVAQVDVDVGGLGAEGGGADEQGQKQWFLHGGVAFTKKGALSAAPCPLARVAARLDGQDEGQCGLRFYNPCP